MRWNQWQRIRSYASSSLWIIPFIAIPLDLVATRILHRIDRWLDWKILAFGTAGAEALYQNVVTMTLTFLVFTFGSLLVAIQVASGQLTPRIIATTLLRDNVVRLTVGLFTFTFLFALSALGRTGTTVYQLVVFATALLGVSCIAAFLYLIDYAARLLRPVSIVGHVGRQGLAVIRDVYPDLSRGPSRPDGRREALGAPAKIIQHTGTSEIAVSVRVDMLLAQAMKSNAVIEFVPQVGDFVATDEPLFHLYGDMAAVDESDLTAAVAFGPERTMEQDPTFAFRIVIDIALKALSPAINDPTTAVLAIDQLHRLLRAVGLQHLRTDEIRDDSGRLRVIVRTPNWENFVHLSFNEIRACGANNMQIVRRLRAMIENLIQTLPEYRHPALRAELRLLDFEIEKYYLTPEDIALARVPDSQGLGGSSGLRLAS